MRRLATFLVALALGLTVGACDLLKQADMISQQTITAGCAQPEDVRRAERNKLATNGLWIKCVPRGTTYDRYQLTEKSP